MPVTLHRLAAWPSTGTGLPPESWVGQPAKLPEHANVQAAQDFCQSEPGEADAGLRIAMHVWLLYYWNAGHVSEGWYRLGQALARARAPTVWRAQGLLLASLLATLCGDRGSALPRSPQRAPAWPGS